MRPRPARPDDAHMDRSTPRSTPSLVLLLAVAAALIWVGRGEATENGPSGNTIDSLTSVALPPTTTTEATALHPGLAAALRAATSEAARAGTVITITPGFRTADEPADRKSTRLTSSHQCAPRMPSSACTTKKQHMHTTYHPYH